MKTQPLIDEVSQTVSKYQQFIKYIQEFNPKPEKGRKAPKTITTKPTIMFNERNFLYDI